MLTKKLAMAAAVMEPGELYLAQPVEVQVGGATIFVMDVERFDKF